MNAGFREAMREEEWDCFFFHDVDLIPEDDRNTYTCDSNPKHAAIAMDKFGYKYVQPLLNSSKLLLLANKTLRPFSEHVDFDFFCLDFRTRCILVVFQLLRQYIISK